ncbi:hypothetical protein XENOCAPTIV_028791 [Xenoophorus captivus]|uniref:Uncharacterized protein n=1 Tax=Xenoophorus captivus TaxID=1517983 RepID=A0ABV0QK80_9TELE
MYATLKCFHQCILKKGSLGRRYQNQSTVMTIWTSLELKSTLNGFVVFQLRHRAAVGSTVALQQEHPGFDSRPGIFLCMFSPSMRGFSPVTPASSQGPKHDC